MTDHAYFLYHSIGMYPEKEADLRRALGDFAAVWSAHDDSQWPQVLTARAEFIAGWEALIGAAPGTLTTAENVTTALYSLVGALPSARLKGRRILVAQDCFPSLHFLLSGLAPRLGFTLDTVPLRPGEFWVRDEDMIARWGEDVALALLTFVTSTASHRPDLSALTAHGRKMGSLIAVDLTQGIGILPYDIGQDTPDIVVSTTLKWLCGPPGAGMLYVRPDLLGECKPELRGWFSQENPFSWDLDAFRYAGDARRFDHGTPSAVAAVAAVAAMNWHRGQDGAALLAHSRALGEAILAGAPRLGLKPACPADAARRGGSVMLELPAGTDGAALIGKLREEHVHADVRGRVLRLSPGNITAAAHVERLFAGLRRHLS